MDDWNVYFVGIEIYGVNFKVIEVMKEVGIDILNYILDLIDNNIIKNLNLVVILCSDVDVNCFFLLINVKKEYWGFDDLVGKFWLEF